MSLGRVGVSICVVKVSENCVKVESSSEGAVLFHIVWVVVRGIGVCGEDAVMGEITGVRAGVLVGNLRGCIVVKERGGSEGCSTRVKVARRWVRRSVASDAAGEVG